MRMRPLLYGGEHQSSATRPLPASGVKAFYRPVTKSRLTTSLDRLAVAWTEVEPSQEVREQARRALRLHPLRAADALQLAAALVWIQGQPGGQHFVCLDRRLREAAQREGFLIFPSSERP
jgi:predicted nucleic acid-binding protein